jgi:uracil-DNA glycosylase family 4
VRPLALAIKSAAMNDFHRVLDVTEQHLLTLKAAGVRFLSVEHATLNQLSEPPPLVLETQEDRGNGTNGTDMPGLELRVPPSLVEAQSNGEDLETGMAQLRQRASACLKCPHLVKSRKNVVFGVGDIHAQLMFVGEAPGADEDAQGEPFVGAAGQLLTRIIKAMGLSRESVYIANILKCRPDTPGQSAGNRKPTADEMKTCLPYLLAQIDLIHPKVLVALGATAIEGLLGAGGGIGKLRGKFQIFRDIPLMPTFHPAYLLRNQSLMEKRKVWEDMLQVMEKLQMSISEKQRAYFLKG